MYVAPPQRQIAIDPEGVVRITDDEPNERWRPSIDRLFASVAASYGPRAIAVVLTGRLDDGAQGVRVVKTTGGRVLVEDPATAEEGSMPRAAMATGCIDFVLPVDAIAAALIALVALPGAEKLLRVPTPPWALRAP